LSPFPTLLDAYLMLRATLDEALPATVVSADLPPDTPMSALVDLASSLQCRLLIPRAVDDHTLRASFEKLDPRRTFHGRGESGPEKYGTSSTYADIRRLDDPGCFTGLWEALSIVPPREGDRILNLGVNTGDEFEIVERFCKERTKKISFVGIDICESALAVARSRFPDERHRFHVHDINRLEDLTLGRFNLLISVATLHSPGVDSKRVFMWAMQHLLAPGAGIIIGFPNCRFMDGEPVYGARTKNRSEQDMSLVIKDIHFVKKYLQQHGYRVVVNGKNYLFVTGQPIPSRL